MISGAAQARETTPANTGWGEHLALPVISLPPDFHLGTEGDFVVIAAAEGM